MMFEFIKKLFGKKAVPLTAKKVSPELKDSIDRFFEITGWFEGTGYTKLEGNFDGQGFTYGLFGFCLGQGSLQTLLKKMYHTNPKLFRDCCNTIVNGKQMNIADNLLQVVNMNNEEAVKWSLQRQNSTRPFAHWVAVFANLGRQPQFQQLQRDYGMGRIDRAIQYCKKYNLKTERALALFFDTCVQQGSIKFSTQVKLTARGIGKKGYHDKMRMIAQAMSEQAKDRWAADVLSRRLCIVNGKGKVHGTYLDLKHRFGLDDSPLDLN
jgi:hypothetical protein